MEEQFQQIDNLVTRNELKKAEFLIAKLLRTKLSQQIRFGLLFRRARVRFLLARPEDALDDLFTMRNSIPTEFNTPPTLELLGDCYFARFELSSVGFTDRNDTLLAQEIYKQIIRDFPQYVNVGWVYYQLGRICVTVGETESALEFFQQALLKPSYVNALTAYCYERLAFIAFYEQRDSEKALSFLTRAIDTYPGRAAHNWLVQVHLLQSRVLRGMHDYTRALEAAEKALSLVSNSSDNKLAFAEALLTTGELLAELQNRDKEVINVLQQFIQNVRKPLGVDVTWSRVNEMMGNAFFNLGQYENAIASYQSVLQLNPDHPWALSFYYKIARSYYQLSQYEEAIRNIEHMLKTASIEEQAIDDYRVYDTLGNAQFALGHYESAVKSYQTAIQMAPSNAENILKIKSYYDLARERI
jgi:tetratricopeptide (TPR) repeat protein